MKNKLAFLGAVVPISVLLSMLWFQFWGKAWLLQSHPELLDSKVRERAEACISAGRNYKVLVALDNSLWQVVCVDKP